MDSHRQTDSKARSVMGKAAKSAITAGSQQPAPTSATRDEVSPHSRIRVKKPCSSDPRESEREREGGMGGERESEREREKRHSASRKSESERETEKAVRANVAIGVPLSCWTRWESAFAFNLGPFDRLCATTDHSEDS